MPPGRDSDPRADAEPVAAVGPGDASEGPVDPHGSTHHVDAASVRPPPRAPDTAPRALAPTGLVDWAARPFDGAPTTADGAARGVPATRAAEPGLELGGPIPRTHASASAPDPSRPAPRRRPLPRSPPPRPKPRGVAWGVAIGAGCTLALGGLAAAAAGAWLLSAPAADPTPRGPVATSSAAEDPPTPPSWPLPMEPGHSWVGTLRCPMSSDRPLSIEVVSVYGRVVRVRVRIAGPRPSDYPARGVYDPVMRGLRLEELPNDTEGFAYTFSGRFDEAGRRYVGVTWDPECGRFDLRRGD